ncbi:MAG: hypothetical protein QMD80_07405 [archaeon]|nr:hypothetical protein [archaeon]
MLEISWKSIAIFVPKKLATKITEHILKVLERMAIGTPEKKIASFLMRLHFMK